VELSKSAAEAIARALYAVAKVDGVHEREAGLIASFWIEAGGGAGALSDLERAATPAPAELAAALHTDQERQLFLKTAILLTYADGKVSDEERKIVGEYSKALGLSAQLEALEHGVKEYLLGHLSSLHNSEAVTNVAKKLNV
jgi:tellurite resistance protein